MTPKFIISTEDKPRFSPLAEALEALIQADISWAESGKTALAQAGDTPPVLVVIDETLPDMTGVELARELLKKNALINTALVSELSPEDFHEFSEGLGVLLQLPPAPEKEKAQEIISALKGIFALA
jgi:PleD family two-component response regulator